MQRRSGQSTAVPRISTTAARFAEKPKTAEGKRLSVQECRKVLGADCTLTDEQLKTVCVQLSALAGILVTEFAKGRNSRETQHTAQNNEKKAA